MPQSYVGPSAIRPTEKSLTAKPRPQSRHGALSVRSSDVLDDRDEIKEGDLVLLIVEDDPTMRASSST
jgi:hypothetical protein